MSKDLEKDMNEAIINGLEVKKTNKNPLTREALELVTGQLKKCFGPDYELTTTDLDLFSFCIYPFNYVKNVNILAYLFLSTLWAFLLDDHLDKNHKDFKRWIKYIQNKNCTDSGKMGKLSQLMLTEYRQLLDSEFIEEHLNGTMKWLNCAYSNDQAYKYGEIKMSDEEFLELRLIDADGLAYLACIKYDCQLKVNDELKENPDWICFNKQAMVSMILYNEMFSLKREIKDGLRKFNYVYVKMKNKNFKISAQESMDEIVGETKECERLALEYGNKLKQLKNDCLDQYVDGVFKTMHGHAYVSTMCKRYNK